MVKQGVFLLRADQYQDPGKWFVSPHVDISGLDNGSHPIRLIGSRGSGKTMILRSIAAKPIGESLTAPDTLETERLRIYIRPDNQLMGGMTGWGLPQEVWKTASIELLLLRIFEEAAKKLVIWLESHNLPTIKFDEEAFCFSEKGQELVEWIRYKQHRLYIWARCPDNTPPIAIAALSLLASLLKSIEKIYPSFPKNLHVSVYFDEQEIYRSHQQIIINDWIKNPPEGWVFHVAHRRYLQYETKTSTNEVIEKSNDFKEIDLDEPLVGTTDEARKNRTKFYKKIILNEVQNFDSSDLVSDDFSPEQFLPSLTKPEIANQLREETYAKEAWGRLTDSAAKYSNTDPAAARTDGNSLEDSRLWVLWPMMVARGAQYEQDEKKLQNIIHNYLTGAILQLYFEAKGRVPMYYYSGFSAICSIVLSNVREFILILKQAIEYETQDEKKFADMVRYGISGTSQFKAVISRSKQFNTVVAISAAEHGNDIEKALNNWFLFFSNVQRLPTLPYNEPNHITSTDSIQKNDPAWTTIEAGEKHGAFIFTLSSKQRTGTKDNQIDIRVHPLLSAKHYLAYTKRNTMSLSFAEISKITSSSSDNEVRTIASSLDKTKHDMRYQKSLF